MRISNFSSMCHFFLISRGRARQLHLRYKVHFRSLKTLTFDFLIKFKNFQGLLNYANTTTQVTIKMFIPTSIKKRARSIAILLHVQVCLFRVAIDEVTK